MEITGMQVRILPLGRFGRNLTSGTVYLVTSYVVVPKGSKVICPRRLVKPNLASFFFTFQPILRSITRGFIDTYESSQSSEELSSWLSAMQTKRGKGILNSLEFMAVHSNSLMLDAVR